MRIWINAQQLPLYIFALDNNPRVLDIKIIVQMPRVLKTVYDHISRILLRECHIRTIAVLTRFRDAGCRVTISPYAVASVQEYSHVAPTLSEKFSVASHQGISMG